MSRAGLLLTFLLVATWGWAQSEPASPAPDVQASPGAAPQSGTHHRFPGVAGTITAIAADSITLKALDGKTVQINLSDKTQYRKGRQPAKLADFKVGDEIAVRGEPAGDRAWQADMVMARPAGSPGMQSFRDALGKRFIIGEIKSINGTQLAIERPDGVTQTISVDETTSFQKDGESITLADLKPGDHVFGRGEVKSDVFVPSVLNLGDPRMMFRGSDQAPGGQRGPGAGNQAAPPESH
jgi:hypothetical protein